MGTVRKVAVTFFILFSCIGLAFAGYRTGQRMVSVDDPVMRSICSLYADKGIALPYMSGPWSRNEVLYMIELLESKGLSERDAEVLEKIREELEDDGIVIGRDSLFPFAISLSVNLDAGYHTNTEFNSEALKISYPIWESDGNYTTSDITYWYNGYDSFRKKLSAPFTIRLDLAPTPNTFISSDFWLNSTGNNGDKFGSENFISKLSPIYLFNALDCNIPYSAYLSLGGNNWNVLAGRERFSWGMGESGNLMLSDNLPYHTGLRFTAFGEYLKYTFLSTFYTHPSMFDKGSQDAEMKGMNMFLAHRLEFRILEKVNLSLSEAIMYQNTDGYIDPMVFNPAMLFHSYYIRGNANSSISVELAYVPVKHFTLYGELLVDKFIFNEASYTELHNPNAIGMLAGVKYTNTFANGIQSKTSFEAAYTSPYLYLRGNNVSFIGSFREFNVATNLKYNMGFIGYVYGNDNLVFQLKEELFSVGSFDLSASLTYIIDGDKGIDTQFEMISGALNGPSGNTRNIILFESALDYNLSDHFSIKCGFDVIGNGKTDVQLSLGVGYHL